MLETIVNVCAVMAFMLSVWNALHQHLVKRTRLSIRDVCIYKRRHAEKPFTAMRLTICNLSETPLSIIGIRIRSGKRWVRAYQPRMKIASLTNNSNEKTEELFSTAFPFNLSPLESRCIYVVLPIRHIRFHRFGRRYHLKRNCQESGCVKLRLDMPRNSVDLKVRAEVDSPERIFDVLRANCR